MDKKFIKMIQKKVEDLLLTLSDNLQVAAKDQCSEIARLVGCWILEKQPKYKVQILKGEFPNGSAHDILAIECKNKLFLIDPTIWQIFPESSNIFVGTVHNISEAIDLFQKKYGGV